MYAFDIDTLEDLKRKVRSGMELDGSGESEQQVEEELEKWVANVMSWKAGKEKKESEVERK